MPSPDLTREVFLARYAERFYDPAFDSVRGEIDRLAAIAWEAYSDGRKAPRTVKAGAGFADPDYDLAEEWLASRAALHRARGEHARSDAPPAILIVNASPRSEHSCPAEMSKSWRLVEHARTACEEEGASVEVLDLSRTTSEYGRHIHPCKSCFSTAAALCHWPCSCYPNHSLGQVQDWMAEIYPMWVRAHGVLLVSPVHWYSPTSPLKLMMDRLVCADGGNPDPTSTQGKDGKLAKQLELAGWPYDRHLAGRLFGVVVHGDAEGAENVRRALSDWLSAMDLRSAGAMAEVDRYVGYWKPYATSHLELDADEAIFGETANAARTLVRAVRVQRAGHLFDQASGLSAPRDK